MGKSINTYIAVAYLFFSLILKRAFWILLSILLGNIALLLIEHGTVQFVLKLYCLSNILLLWFVDMKELSLILKIVGIQSSVMTAVKVTALGVLLIAQIWSF